MNKLVDELKAKYKPVMRRQALQSVADAAGQFLLNVDESFDIPDELIESIASVYATTRDLLNPQKDATGPQPVKD